MMYLVHSLAYLKANFHEDEDGDFWESEEALKEWYATGMLSSPSVWIRSSTAGTVIEEAKYYRWAIERSLSKKDYPEEYL